MIYKKIQRDYAKAERDDDRIEIANRFDERRIFRMVQAQRLESRLEGMIQVESQQDDQNDVDDRVGIVGEKVDCHAVEVMVVGNPDRPFRSAGDPRFDQVEVHQVNDQEDADDDPCMDHEFGEE